MSRFLAPIHFKQYDKIKNQEEIVSYILALNEEQNWVEDLRYMLINEVGEISYDTLEDIIDEDNIHGWLSEKINVVEMRLAYTVERILLEDRERLVLILDGVKSLGREENLSSHDLMEIYNIIDGRFLNGMPCDRVNEILDTSMDSLSWTMHEDIHSHYWEEANERIYYKIKNAFISGLIEGTGLVFLELDEKTFKLSRI